jgi:hypothetical protein
MPDSERETVTVTVDAEAESRTIELPAEFVEFIREPGESAADVVADLVVFSGAQRTYEAVHYSEGDLPAELHEVDEQMQELFETEFGTTLQDAAGYPDPPDDH